LNIESKTIINDKAIVYCRVSSANQKNDLESQIKAMELFSLGGGIVIDKIIPEVVA
jgi:putative resolvase